MLFTSSDEDVGAILKQYSEMEETLEKNLMLLSIKSEGKLSLSEVYQMSYLERECYINAFNEYADEKNKKSS